MDRVRLALRWSLDAAVLVVMLLSALFGLFVGAVPGLTATMATALLVPITFFLPPVPAVARDRHGHGDGDLRRRHPGLPAAHPGTPASAAYTDESYAMTRKGQAETGAGHRAWCSRRSAACSAPLVLIVAAPALAEVALKFSSFEYFWLVLLGLTCAVFITSRHAAQGPRHAAARAC